MAAGAFLETEKESGLPMPNQHIYVKMKKGVGQIGQKYLIVKDMGLIRKLNSQVEGKIDARFIQVYGDIELTDTAPTNFSRSSDKENYDVFRGLILHAINLTRSDFSLIPGQMQSVNMKAIGPEGSTTAQIIGSMKHEASALYGIGDIVFLNKGARDGIADGQILDIYIDRSIRDAQTPVTFSTLSSGQLKIAKTSSTVSTAVVLKAVDSIQQGDRAQPKMAPNHPDAVPSMGSAGGGAPGEGEFDLPPGNENPAGAEPVAPLNDSDFDVQ